MANTYFIVENDRQAGPYTLEQLASLNLTPDTLVWTAGMPQWVKAGEVEELSEFIMPTPPPVQKDETLWFAMLNGQRVGPMTFDALRTLGANADTPVWTEGMPAWRTVREIPTLLGQLINDNNRTRNFQNNAYQSPGFKPSPQNGWQQAPVQTNWMTWAIVATVAGFLFSCVGAIFGIIGIVNADKANKLRMQGLDNLAEQANSTAKTMTIIALIIAGVGFLATCFLFSFSVPLLGGIDI